MRGIWGNLTPTARIGRVRQLPCTQPCFKRNFTLHIPCPFIYVVVCLYMMQLCTLNLAIDSVSIMGSFLRFSPSCSPTSMLDVLDRVTLKNETKNCVRGKSIHKGSVISHNMCKKRCLTPETEFSDFIGHL